MERVRTQRKGGEDECQSEQITFVSKHWTVKGRTFKKTEGEK